MKVGIFAQMGDVFQLAGREIVDDVDFVTPGQESFSQMRADEPGPAGDKISHLFISHLVV